jgi:hypothetical protein
LVQTIQLTGLASTIKQRFAISKRPPRIGLEKVVEPRLRMRGQRPPEFVAFAMLSGELEASQNKAAAKLTQHWRSIRDDSAKQPRIGQ